MSHGGDASHFFNQHLADFRRIGCRAAPEQAHVWRLHQRAVVKPHTAEAPGAHVPVNSPRNALSERIGLLVDFLVHVVRCITEFRLTPRIFEHRDARLNAVPLHRRDAERIAVDNSHVAVLKVDHALGMRSQRVRIARHEGFTVALADDERGAVSGANQHVMVLEEDAKAPCATQSPKGGLDRFQWRCTLVERKGDHLSDDFRVGFADAGDASCFQALAKLLEILNDAVVNKVDLAVVRSVRMRVDLRYTAVGGPAGMGDAERALHGGRKNGFEVGHLADGFVRGDGAFVFNSNAR